MSATTVKPVARTPVGRARRGGSRPRRRLLVDITVVLTFLAAWITHDQGATVHSVVSLAFTAAALVHARLRQPGWSRRRRLDHLTFALVAAIAVSGMVDWIGSGAISSGHGAIAVAGTLIVVAHVWQHRRSLRRLIERARNRSRLSLPSPAVGGRPAALATDSAAGGRRGGRGGDQGERVDQPSAMTPVALTVKPAVADDGAAPPIVCTLDTERAQQRVEEWYRIVGGPSGATSALTRRQRIDSGIRLEFDDTVDTTALVSLAQAEHECCRFFSFAITIDTRGIGLDVTAPADAYPLIEALFAAP